MNLTDAVVHTSKDETVRMCRSFDVGTSAAEASGHGIWTFGVVQPSLPWLCPMDKIAWI
jgi:hypothetical protein